MLDTPLKNLRTLRDKMVANEKAVIVFRFTYKNIPYFIAVCLLTEEDSKRKEAKYYLVRLCFMKADNISDFLECYANSAKITAGLTELRRFFGVEYQPNGIDWINAFSKHLGDCIPLDIPTPNDREQKVIVGVICRHEGRDPNRIYRSYIFCNGKEKGKQKHRTEYNGQLASIRFPLLYPLFKNNKIVSFAFTDNIDDEKSEEEIMKNFVKNERKK